VKPWTLFRGRHMTCGCNKALRRNYSSTWDVTKTIVALRLCNWTLLLLSFFLTFSVMYFTSYRVFSSFHQHNFVSLSLSFCADVTGFVTERTDGARDTKKKALIRTVYARNEGVFHLLDCQSLCTSLFCSFLPLALSKYFYFIVSFILSFPSFIS